MIDDALILLPISACTPVCSVATILLWCGGQGARAESPRHGRSSHQSPPVSPRPHTHTVLHTLIGISPAGN